MTNPHWQNRIIGYKQIPVSDLLANPLNARRHPPAQRDALRGSLDALGWVAPVITNKDGYLLDGHARVEELLSRDENALIPVIEVDLTEDEASLFLASFDWITSLATYDRDSLDTLLQAVNTDNEALQTMLAGMAEANDLYFGDAPVIAEDMGAQIDRADELQAKWQVARGDVWVIPSITGNGSHRLLCGDSTNADDVALVMDGENAHIMFTDPPYGVDYTGGHFHSGDVNIKRERPKLENDAINIYPDFLKHVPDFVDGACYMFFAGSHGYDVYSALHHGGFEIHALIIWHKVNATYAAMNAQYKQRHEPCLYFKPKGKTLRWCGASDENTLWEIKRDAINDKHPTQKPVELALKAIGNHDAVTVYDPFGGSGSTMVACEQLSRQCRMIEISEKYCAVILERMSALGCTPTKAD